MSTLWFDRPTFGRPDQDDCYDDAEIGHVQYEQTVELTRVVASPDDDDRLVFRGEVSAKHTVAVREVRTSDAVWMRHRIEFRAKSTELAKHDLVYAWRPYELAVYDGVPFRGANKRGAVDFDAEMASSDDFDADRDLTPAIRSRGTEPFESRTGVYTAAVEEPAPSFRVDGPQRNVRAKSIVVGFCKNYEEACERLREDPDIRHLEDLTRKRTLDFGMAGAKIYENIIDECLADLHAVAIPQALAGPEDYSDETWNDRPVADLVDRIYRAHVNNRNRRERNRPRKRGRGPDVS